ncbi:MAG: rod-binding protein [Negativicutes bacterium]|nr:rod-binding protein [Negativicutes bacterium]
MSNINNSYVLTDLGMQALGGAPSPRPAATVRAANGTSREEDERLRAACREMESLFLNLLMKQMRSTIDKSDSLIPYSLGQRIAEAMYDSEMTRGLAQKGDVGLAEMLYRQLQREQKRTAGESLVKG